MRNANLAIGLFFMLFAVAAIKIPAIPSEHTEEVNFSGNQRDNTEEIGAFGSIGAHGAYQGNLSNDNLDSSSQSFGDEWKEAEMDFTVEKAVIKDQGFLNRKTNAIFLLKNIENREGNFTIELEFVKADETVQEFETSTTIQPNETSEIIFDGLEIEAEEFENYDTNIRIYGETFYTENPDDEENQSNITLTYEKRESLLQILN